MAEYIERDKVLEAILNLPPKMDEQGYGWLARGGLYQLIRDFQSADVAPVVHGKWENKYNQFGDRVYPLPTCSVCGFCTHIRNNYCPDCGARMDDKDINVPCKTNADRIRSMSDEELAMFLCSILGCDDCPAEKLCDSKETLGLLIWLKEEVSE